MMLKEGLNIISSNDYEKEVNEEYNNSVLVVDEEVLENSLVELLEEVNLVLEESHDISPLKLPNFLPTMLGILHIIGLEQHVELPYPLPLTRDGKDEDNLNLLGCVQTISTKASNSVCSAPYPQSYNFHSYKPKKFLEFFFYIFSL
jgi:hypothetical protein